MNELKDLLENVEDSYHSFTTAMLHYAGKNSSRRDKLIDFIKTNPNAKSSDIVRFVSDQPDFAEDAAYMSVG